MDTGVLADWNDERGFGFIENNGSRTFVHISAFNADRGRPRQGDLVNFELGLSPDGRQCAVRASRSGPGRTAARRRLQPLPLTVAAALTVVVIVGFWTGWLTPWLGVLYLVMSVFTAGLYALDKRRAIDGGWRVPEANLQVAALLGGWPGAVLAQQLLRHKCSKRSFQLVFWFVVVLNLVLFSVFSHPGWLLG